MQSLLPNANEDPYAPLPSEHPLRAMVAAPALHAAAMVAHDMGPVGETRAFDVAQRGELVFDGGLADLQEILLGRLDIFGADRRERLTPVEVVVRRGRVAGVRVRPRDETIGCHHLLWASSAASLVAALEQPPRALTARAAGRGLSLRDRAARRRARHPGGDAGAHPGDRRSVARADRGQRRRHHRRPAGRRRPARADVGRMQRAGATWSTPAPATCARCAAGWCTRWGG